MQADLIGITPEKITPYRGWVFGKPDIGEYETESGILVVRTLKKNPKVDRFKVLKTGGPFWVCSDCKRSVEIATVPCRGHNKRMIPWEYHAEPGDWSWPRRGAYKKIYLGQTLYVFVRNDDVVLASRLHEGFPDRFVAPGDTVLVEPVYEGFAEGSKLIQVHDRDKEYIGNFKGIVVCVGKKYAYDLKPGDHVRFRRHEGTPIEHEGKKYLALKSKWVDAVED